MRFAIAELQQLGQAVTIEDVVAEDQRKAPGTKMLAGDQERLGDAARAAAARA